MPKTELQLRGIERKFNLNDAIYTFLLQKRSEAQIARASSMPDYEVVDSAVISCNPVKFTKENAELYYCFISGVFISHIGLIIGKGFSEQ